MYTSYQNRLNSNKSRLRWSVASSTPVTTRKTKWKAALSKDLQVVFHFHEHFIVSVFKTSMSGSRLLRPVQSQQRTSGLQQQARHFQASFLTCRPEWGDERIMSIRLGTALQQQAHDVHMAPARCQTQWRFTSGCSANGIQIEYRMQFSCTHTSHTSTVKHQVWLTVFQVQLKRLIQSNIKCLLCHSSNTNEHTVIIILPYTYLIKDGGICHLPIF